jgi:hypothetical protein
MECIPHDGFCHSLRHWKLGILSGGGKSRLCVAICQILVNLSLNLAIPNWVCGIGKNDFFWMMGDCAGFVYHGMVKPVPIMLGKVL